MGAKLFHAGKRTVRQTDVHDEADSRFSQFCERNKKAMTRISIADSS